jgi:Ca2+-binding RTX toxin-like protein
MAHFHFEIDASATYSITSPMLEILVNGVVVSSASISQHTGSGLNYLRYELEYSGAYPTLLQFRFNDGAEGGRSIQINEVRINGTVVDTTYITMMSLNNGQTSSINALGVDHLFGRTAPVVADIGTETITGTGGNDNIIGSSGPEIINAGNGADRVRGLSNDDAIFGGAGNDRIFGAGGNDIISGDDGDDELYGEGGNDILHGGIGNDLINGGDGHDLINGGDGIDTLLGGLGDDIIFGEAGNDTISGGAGNDYLYGDDGNDIITAGAGNDTVYGGLNNDSIYGEAGDDILYGEGGNDLIFGGAGNDTMYGNNGNDTIYAGAGNDTANGGDNNDVINGEAGNDTLNGDLGNDTLIGGLGADTLNGGDGADILMGHGLDYNTISTLLRNNANVVYNASTGSFYQYVNTAVNFATAVSNANAAVLNGVNGHLAVITTAAENTYVMGLINNQTWIGGTSSVNNAQWVWNYGPETGAQYWQGYDTGAAVNNFYANWSAGQPQNNTEYWAVLYPDGTWHDWPDSATQRYVIEWEAGLMADDNAIDTINGGIGNDIIYGYGGNDILNGDADNDIIFGGAGNDTITGGTGADALYGGAGDDNINGDAGNDLIEGDAGNDTLNGGADTDTLTYINATSAITVSLAITTAQVTGGAGTDTISNFENLIGSVFNDTIEGTSGNNVLDGAAGIDTLSYANAASAVTVNLATTTGQNTVGSGTDTITNFENLIGSAFNDTLTGDGLDNVIEGGLGNDTMNGAGGTDTLTYANATAGIAVSLALATAQVTGGAGTDTISNFENLIGSGFNDILAGNSGNNILTGGAGNDTVNYAVAAAGVTVNLAILTAQNTVGDGTDTLTGFENIRGSAFNDTLTGDGTDNIIEGGAGNDTMNGAGGNDTVSFENAASAITFNLATTTAQNTGGAGTDTVSNFENVLGSGFNDIITGTTGNNVLNGGGGTDTLSYKNATSAVTVNLSTATAQNTGGAGTDTITNFENLIGSQYNDNITGTGTANTLIGGRGSDTLNGGAGDDILYAASIPITLFTANFNTGADSFAYADNSFGGTGGAYVNGTRITTDGVNGNGALEIIFDGTNATASGTMSGAFSRTFTASQDVDEATLTFQYKVIRSGTYETNEDTFVYVEVDGIRYGINGNDYVTRMESDGNDPGYDTGWRSISINLGTLSTGNHTVTMGGLVEGKDAADEDSTIRFDNIQIATASNNDDAFANVLNGGADNDTLYGSAGADALNGDDGADTIYSGSLASVTSAAVLAANAGVVYNATTNSFYRYVTTTLSWEAANSAAAAATINGITGHLAHSNSATENAYIDTISGTASIWLGGSDGAVNGEWRWVGGPNDGQQFWQGQVAGTPVGGAYTNWSAGEPNDYNGFEANVEMVNGGQWNDQLPGTTRAYVIEWEASQILVTSNATTIHGGNGNDVLYGGAGNDILYGDAGVDTIHGGTGTQTLYGGADGDTINSNSVDTLTAQINAILAANASLVYNATTGSFYQFVDTNVTWATATANAAAATVNGVAGHLVQITTTAENTYIDTLSGTRNIWMGGADSGTEGVWVWLGGVMNGIQFWQGTSTGSVRNGFYENWGTGMPDVSNADDDGLRMANGGDWQDSRTNGTTNNRYVIEWELSAVVNPTSSTTLYGGDGLDTLNGGAGRDIFVFESASAFNNIDVINNYDKTDLDRLDISDILTGFTPGSSDVDAFARFTVSGSDLLLQVDANGATGGAAYTSVARLTGLGTSGLNIEEMVANNFLIMS